MSNEEKWSSLARFFKLVFLFWIGSFFVFFISNFPFNYEGFVSSVSNKISRQLIIPIIIFSVLLVKYRFNCIASKISYIAASTWIVGMPLLRGLVRWHIIPGVMLTAHEWSGIDILLGWWILVILYSVSILYCGVKKTILHWIIYVLYIVNICAVFFIPCVELLHVLKFGFLIESNTIYAIQQTNFSEAVQFFYTSLNYVNSFIILMFFSLLLSVIFLLKKSVKNCEISKKSLFFVLLITVSAMYVFGHTFIDKFDIAKDWMIIHAYRVTAEKYVDLSAKRMDDIKLYKENNRKGTYILVIGESETRDYMKCYNAKIPYDNTPWLEREFANQDFYIFKHVYSCLPTTDVALQNALTEMSQYNKMEFLNAVSIIEVAKKAGYKTYWFSTQNVQNPFGSRGDRIGSISDVVGVPTVDSFGNIYDDSLLDYLKKVNPNGLNFVVLHINGGHIDYNKRYPKSREKWNDGTKLGEYSNTVLYTDTFLKQVYIYAKDNLNLQAMVYVPDHGEDVNLGHHPKYIQHNQVAIPMFIYLSKQYQKEYPSVAYNLSIHQKDYFTNDMLYNTLCGLMGIESNHYDKKEDLSGKYYNYDKKDLFSYMGVVPLTDKRITE